MKKTIFQEIMGTNPRIKVLEYLLEWNRYDLTISDIARGSKISRNKATEIINELTKKNILVNTRNIGQGQFYLMNKDNETVKLMLRLFKIIVENN